MCIGRNCVWGKQALEISILSPYGIICNGMNSGMPDVGFSSHMVILNKRGWVNDINKQIIKDYYDTRISVLTYVLP